MQHKHLEEWDKWLVIILLTTLLISSFLLTAIIDPKDPAILFIKQIQFDMFSFFKKRYSEKGGGIPDPLLPEVPVGSDFVSAENRLSKPKKFSIRDKMPPVGTQLISDCVGWSGAYLREYQEKIETGSFEDFSGLGIYTLAKQEDGYAAKGTYISMSTYIPEKYGTPFEVDAPEAPYPDDPVLPALSSFALFHAQTRKVKSSVLIDRGAQNSFSGITDALWMWKQPVVVGATWYENTAPNRNGVLPLPDWKEKFGHAVAATGYNDETEQLEFINSWGLGWGQEGYGYFPYNYPLFANGWTSIDLPNEPSKPKPQEGWATFYGRKRNLGSEQRNALMLQQAIYSRFAPYDRARYSAGRNWSMYVNALVYGDYSLTDVINDIFSVSRSKGHIFNFNEIRR